MRQRVFEHKGKEYTLTARGPEEQLDKALAAAEVTIRTAEMHLSGLLDVYDCIVRIRWS